MPRQIVLKTYKHLGDYTSLTCALYNAKQAYPDTIYSIDTRGFTAYSELFQNNPNVGTSGSDKVDVFVNYGGVGNERAGAFGNFMEAFSRSIGASLEPLFHRPIQMVKKVADFYILPEEYSQYKMPDGDYCLINANCQTSMETKGYPFWQEVVNKCPDIQFVQIGNDGRDISSDLKGVVDYRGKTTVRHLVILASKAKYILSGPSGIIHVGSAFPDVRKIVLTGARDPATFYEYPNTVIMSTHSCGCGGKTGCIKRHFGPGQCDKYCVSDTNQKFAQCMSNIRPEQIAEELHKVV